MLNFFNFKKRKRENSQSKVEKKSSTSCQSKTKFDNHASADQEHYERRASVGGPPQPGSKFMQMLTKRRESQQMSNRPPPNKRKFSIAGKIGDSTLSIFSVKHLFFSAGTSDNNGNIKAVIDPPASRLTIGGLTAGPGSNAGLNRSQMARAAASQKTRYSVGARSTSPQPRSLIKSGVRSSQVQTLEGRLQFLKDNQLSFIRDVDSGAFSTIYHCQTDDEKGTKTDVAVKRISLQKKSNQKFLSRFLEREILIHSTLKHQNIVRYNDTLLDDPYDIYLVLEWMPLGNLLDYCRLHGRLDNPTVKSISWQMLDALNYMHNYFIVHCIGTLNAKTSY